MEASQFTAEQQAAIDDEVNRQVQAGREAAAENLSDEQRAAMETEIEARMANLKPPEVDHPPVTREDVEDLAKAFMEFRKEIADLRNELAAVRKRPQTQVAHAETLEDRTNARLAEIAQHEFYCPGCGILGDYPQKCRGTDERPHKALEMVKTDELGGDPAQHTAAPSTMQEDAVAA